ADLAEGTRQAELAGVEHTVRVECLLQPDEHVERRTECIAHEPGAVESDTVVVAERAAVRERRALAGVPHGAVVAVSLVPFDLSRVREVQASTLGVAVGLMGGRSERSGYCADGGNSLAVDAGERGPESGDTHRVDN